MSHSNEAKPHARELARPNWSAVFAVAFCVACLITVEFLPVSLLTPMALDLGISEGMAGQSVTTTAFVAMFSSLFITTVIGKTDRRYVVILFSLLLTLSCTCVPVFAFIGSNGEEGCPDWHSPHFVGLDESLQAGVEFYANAALTVLNELS